MIQTLWRRLTRPAPFVVIVHYENDDYGERFMHHLGNYETLDAAEQAAVEWMVEYAGSATSAEYSECIRRSRGRHKRQGRNAIDDGYYFAQVLRPDEPWPCLPPAPSTK